MRDNATPPRPVLAGRKPRAPLETLSFRVLAALRPERAFLTCGRVGVIVGLPLTLLTAAHLRLSAGLTFTVAVLGIATLLATGMIAKILTGTESFVYFRDVLFIFVVMGSALWAAHRPMLPYLDSLVLGAGAFVACGRIGCLFAGCCHGRPCRWGMRYGEEHVRTGFAPWLRGVRLFPVQAVESLWVLCIVLTGTIWIWRGSVPGAVFALYIVAYAFGRFFLELLRGDEGRPYLLGFSEGQWTSVILVAGVILAQRWQLLPRQAFPFLALAVLSTTCLALYVWRGRDPASHVFFSAKHINEIARALAFLENRASFLPEDAPWPGPSPIDVASTSKGLQISFGRIRRLQRSVTHFTVSHEARYLRSSDARSLATLIAVLCRWPGPTRAVLSSRGVFHVLFVEDSRAAWSVSAQVSATGRMRFG